VRAALFVRDGDEYRPALRREIMAAAREAAAHMLRRGTEITSPKRAYAFLQAQLGGLDHERFGVLHLDARHRLIAAVEMFTGTIDGASIHPREVVKAAIEHGTAAVVLYHNHPSGSADPSRADEVITQRLKDALGLIDVRVVDHVIVAGSTCTSLAERGLL
jgi:DNA repair protein RadC